MTAEFTALMPGFTMHEAQTKFFFHALRKLLSGGEFNTPVAISLRSAGGQLPGEQLRSGRGVIRR
jgi:hypothetical protein